MTDLECKKPKLCEPEPAPAPVPCSPAFDLCVGDHTLHWDGFCPTVERPRHTPDGTYTSVTVVDGCIVGYGYAEEATYTPPYCNPNPTHCQETGTGATADVKISASPDNTLTQTSGGLFTRSYVQGGNGVTVGGTGTVTNPYTVSLSTSTTTGGTVAVVGRNGLVSETTNTGVTYVGLEDSGVKTGVYDVTDQFTVDRFGRIVAVTPRQDPLVSAGSGLEAVNQGDSVQIGHPTNNIDNNMVLGAYVVGVTDTGHIISTNRAITLDDGIYHIGAYNIGINAYGSISSIVQRTDVMPSSGTFTTRDGKIISYDVTGRLTGIADSNTNLPNTPTSAPMPLRDLYKVTPPAEDGFSHIRKEIYGSDTQMVWYRNQVRISLPSYVVQRNQIEVQGAASWTVDVLQGELVVSPVGGDATFTVAFRG